MRSPAKTDPFPVSLRSAKRVSKGTETPAAAFETSRCAGLLRRAVFVEDPNAT
jgi:hypothetical protein